MKDGISKVNDKVYSVLMIGQSNMAGRGEFADVPKIVNKDCFMLRNGRWQIMHEPVNPDRCIFKEESDFHSGTSLAAAFADEMSRTEKIKVGLIPCADGGTSLNLWMPGGVLFDHAVMMCKLAMRTSELVAIIWHQGEADGRRDELVDTYKDRFIKMMSEMRRQLGCDVPVILGEIARGTAPKWEIGERTDRLNAAFADIACELPMCAVASSEGLTLKPDGIHFDAKSLRILGKRYYDKYCEIKENI